MSKENAAANAGENGATEAQENAAANAGENAAANAQDENTDAASGIAGQNQDAGTGQNNGNGSQDKQTKRKLSAEERISQLTRARTAAQNNLQEAQTQNALLMQKIAQLEHQFSQMQNAPMQGKSQYDQYTDDQLRQITKQYITSDPQIAVDAIEALNERRRKNDLKLLEDKYSSQQRSSQLQQDYERRAVSRWPELNDTTSQLYKLTVQAYQQLAGNDPAFVEKPERSYLAALEARIAMLEAENEDLKTYEATVNRSKSRDALAAGAQAAAAGASEIKQLLNKGDWRKAIRRLDTIPR